MSPNITRTINIDVANKVKNCMENQWSTLVTPGRKVKVKFKDELVLGTIENSIFISKLSYNCAYYYVTVKVCVKLSGTTTMEPVSTECQLRDLLLL